MRRAYRAAWRPVLGLILSVLLGGGCYLVWLAAFLLTARLDSAVLRVVLWLLAPIVTALGFAEGATLGERLLGGSERFLHVVPWPLGGCAVGAVIARRFGPMLIVVGMLTGGTAGIVAKQLRESLRAGRR